MRIQLHFMRIATFPIASILLTLLVAVVSRPTLAAELKAESDGERYVLTQLKEYEFADLAVLPKDKRQVRASFLTELLISPDVDKKIHLRGIWINDAIVTGDFDLISRDIPNDVSLVNCTFQQDVDLTDAHFVKGLRLSDSKFNHSAYFSGAVIGSDLMVDNCIFMALKARFNDVQVGGQLWSLS
ncbi:MAG TPA: pentapeptide repeat-containing protein [Pyrinomonadaceae bacterium]